MPSRLVGCSPCSICHSDATDGDPRDPGDAPGTLKPLDWQHNLPCSGHRDPLCAIAHSPLSV